jgi:hypothetical protein
MKKFVLLILFCIIINIVNAQSFSISKTNCNINFNNISNSKIWYSYDLYQAVITYNPALDVNQFIISDNLRSNTFTINQIINFASINIIIDSFYSWKTQCINLHKGSGGSIDTSNGTVTSVGLSMPSAFIVNNSPITSADTLIVTGAGTTSQLIDGTGALQTIPTSLPPSGTANGDLNGTYPNPTVDGLQGNPISNISPSNGQVLQWNGSAWIPGAIPSGGSGGGGVVYYFNYQDTTNISPTTGLPTSPVPPSQLGINYSVGAGSITSANLVDGSYRLVCGFVTIVGTPSITYIPAGLWDFNIWGGVAGGTGQANQTQFQVRVYKYNSSTATYTSLANSDAVFIYDPSVIAQYIANVTMPQTTILVTDRIYIEIWAQKNVNQSRQIQFYFDSNHPSHVHTTIPSVAGTGLVKTVNGVFQSPASTLVNADVSASAGINVSKLSMSTSRILGRTTASTGSVEEIQLTTLGSSGSSSLTSGILNIPTYTFDTASLSNRINTKLTSTDTASLSNRINAISNVVQNTTDGATVTGTINNTISMIDSIPANTVKVGDILELNLGGAFVGVNGGRTIRIYFNTIASLSGATQIAVFSPGATVLSFNMKRIIAIKSATSSMVAPSGGSSITSDATNTLALSTLNISWTSKQYIIVAIQLANSADSGYCPYLILKK